MISCYCISITYRDQQLKVKPHRKIKFDKKLTQINTNIKDEEEQIEFLISRIADTGSIKKYLNLIKLVTVYLRLYNLLTRIPDKKSSRRNT